ncbi:hypothetical protein FSP39_023342 [Pinctada imbricata]|uniref:Uncharacterized protein n=1 Tax=Pinctada imbricata TaxID=66713 RepID=A0AA88XIG0_PINIB|nr:hypothetical protein FSP39_023342 [Pinctada imbricata]
MLILFKKEKKGGAVVVLTVDTEQGCTNTMVCSDKQKRTLRCNPQGKVSNERPDFQYVFQSERIATAQNANLGVMCYDYEKCSLYCLFDNHTMDVHQANVTCRNSSYDGITSLSIIRSISHVDSSCFDRKEDWLWFIHTKDEKFDAEQNLVPIVPAIVLIYLFLIAAIVGIWRWIDRRSRWHIFQKGKDSLLTKRASSVDSADLGINFFSEDTGPSMETSTSTFAIGKVNPRAIPVVPPQVPMKSDFDEPKVSNDAACDVITYEKDISKDIPKILVHRDNNESPESKTKGVKNVPQVLEKQEKQSLRKSILADIRSLKLKPPVLPKPRAFARFAHKSPPQIGSKPKTFTSKGEEPDRSITVASQSMKQTQVKVQPPPVPAKPKGYSSLKRNDRDLKKSSMAVFHDEIQEKRNKILAPGLTLHTRIQPNQKSGTQTISTDAFFVEVIEEEKVEEEARSTRSEASTDDESDNQSLKSHESHHSYLDMKCLVHLKKPSAPKADRCSKSSDDSSGSDEDDDSDYQKMKKLCEYRKKGPSIGAAAGQTAVRKRVGRVIKSGEQHTKSSTNETPRVQSKIYRTPEPYKYEISTDDYKAMIENIRGSDPRREVIWNVQTEGREYNYLTSIDCNDRSSDLGKSCQSEKDKPHIISVYFDAESSRADSIGGCSDLARMSYVSALDGIYRTSTSYCASDGSVHYAYVFNGKDEDLHKVSSKLFTSGDLQNKEINLFERDINSSNLTLDSGLSVEMQHSKDTTSMLNPSRTVVQINMCEIASNSKETQYSGERHSVLGSKFTSNLPTSKQFGGKTEQSHCTRTSFFFPGKDQLDLSRQNVDRGSALYANISQLIKR